MKTQTLLQFLIILIVLCGCSKDSEEEIREDDYSGDAGRFLDNRDGQEYQWIRIGEQVWMAENLAYLPSVNYSHEESHTIPHYYVYGFQGNDIDEALKEENYKKHGVLYNWEAAKKSTPQGWRLPSDEDWNQLEQWISNENGGYNKDGDWWQELGKHLKSNNGWAENGNGLNNYDFNAIPSGLRSYGDFFFAIGEGVSFWSNTVYYEHKVFARRLYYNRNDMNTGGVEKRLGMSVRCIKN